MEGKLIKTENGYGLKDCELIAFVSSRRPEHKHHKLSLTNCQAIERGYDLDELAYNTYLLPISTFVEMSKCSQNPYLLTEDFGEDVVSKYYETKAFKAGFQKALEILSDKKFTEDDIRKAIKSSRKGFMQQQHNGYGMPTHSMFVLNDLSSDDIIQSLEQTEWDVTFDPEEKDAEGRLILKRK